MGHRVVQIETSREGIAFILGYAVYCFKCLLVSTDSKKMGTFILGHSVQMIIIMETYLIENTTNLDRHI